MEHFSEESVFIAENWEAVQDILAAIDGLQQDLSALLGSVGEELQERDWWQDGWELIKYEKDQMYISRTAWRSDRDCAVWIGVEDLNPDSVFGDGDAPTLYVWVPVRLRALRAALVSDLEAGPEPVLGELERRASSGYVATEAVRKCLPGGLEGYADAVREQVLEFIDHYARVMMQYDDVIRSMADEGE